MSNIKAIITAIDLTTYQHIGYIIFPIDGNKSFCYRSRTSYNAFASSSRKKIRHINHRTNIDYHCQIYDDLYVNMFISNKSAPVTHVDNIWEFYNLVGYDYKSKKWS